MNNKIVNLIRGLFANPSTGDVTATNTPPQFDNTKLVATMEAVQRALGSFSGYLGFTASHTIVAADIGKHIVFEGAVASQVFTLPLASAIAAGAGFKLTNQGTVNISVARAGSNTINYLTLAGGLTATTLTLKPGDSVFFRSDGTAFWNCADITLAELTPASLATPGFVKLPSGIIIQWGVSGNGGSVTGVSFPIAFPTLCAHVSYGSLASNLTVAGNYYQIAHNTQTVSGFQWGSLNSAGAVNSTASTAQIYWIAIGW